MKKNMPAIVALVIILSAAIAISVYYLVCNGPNRGGSYLYEIEENGVNPGTKGPFPDTPPYVAPPTVPPPGAQ